MDYIETQAGAALYEWKADVGRKTPITDNEAKLFIAGFRRGILFVHKEVQENEKPS